MPARMGVEGAPTFQQVMGIFSTAPQSAHLSKTLLKETSLPLSQGLVTKLGTAPITAGDSREGGWLPEGHRDRGVLKLGLVI